MNEVELRQGPHTAAGRAAARRLRVRISIARAIIDARIDREWSQAQLAKAADVKQPEIAELESIRGDPTIERLAQVVRALGLELSFRSPPLKVRTPQRQSDHVADAVAAGSR